MSTNPNTVKSQHELTNEGGRKTDVLLSTIEKTNDLYEQNQEYIDTIAELGKNNERLQKQLDIALRYFSLIKRNVSNRSLVYTYIENAKTEIKELNK